MSISRDPFQRFIEAASLVAHDHLPVRDMAYSEANGLWATATYNEIAFIQWKSSNCEYLCQEISFILHLVFRVFLSYESGGSHSCQEDVCSM